MALCDIKIKKLYRTKQDDYVNMLISPALQESTYYDRGTGYFTLDSLAELASGLIPFIRNGGNIRVITSVELNEKDIDVIKAGLILQDDTIIKHIHARVIEQVSDDDVLVDLDLITNLIAAGRLSIKIAYMPDGIYHLHMSAICRMVAISAPSWLVPMAVMVRQPRLWASATRERTYSMVMPGTVPGAGSRIISAPAAAKAAMSSWVMIFSAPSNRIPAACIFPAARIRPPPILVCIGKAWR